MLTTLFAPRRVIQFGHGSYLHRVKRTTLRLYGEIQANRWANMGLGESVDDFIDQLAAAGTSEITLLVDSCGGDQAVADSMFLALRRYNVTAIVEGLAGSAALDVIMAARRIVFVDGAVAQTHNGKCGKPGCRRASPCQVCQRWDAYALMRMAERTRQPPAVVSEWMNRELWFDHHDAVRLGLADEICYGRALRTACDLTNKPRPGW